MPQTRFALAARDKFSYYFFGIGIAFLIIVSACDEAGVGSSDSAATVTDKWEAESAARAIDAAADNISLPAPSTTNWNESYDNLAVPGTDDTVRVTGSYARSYTSSASSNTNTVTVDVTFEFINHHYSPYGLTITGFVDYYTRSYSRTTADSYSSSFQKTVKGSDLSIEKPHSDYDDFMTLDTVSVDFGDKNGSQNLITGTLTSSTGEVFSF